MRPPALKAWTSPLLDAEGRCVAREPTDAPRRMWCRSGVQVDDMTERLLTANEVAEILAVPVSWVRESTRSGAMPCRLGRYVRFDLAAVEAWLEECRRPGPAILLRRPAGEA